MQISDYANAVEPSATMAAAQKAKEVAATGATVYDYSLGEPDFNTPSHICSAAYRAMIEGKTHYTAASGQLELKQAICEHHRKHHHLDYAPSQVCVSSGAKHTLYSLLCATINPGDEVLIPAPYWVSYTELVRMVGGVPVVVQTDAADHFKPTAEQLRASCSDKTKMIILNSPSNPTGVTLSKQDLEQIADVVVEKDLMIISDEIYDRLIYEDATFTAFASLNEEVSKRTFTVNGVSKSYAMTGWRIGWTCGDADVIKAMGKIQSQHTSNPSSVSQHAAIAALSGDQTCVESMRTQFAERRKLVFSRLESMPGIDLIPSKGAFYAFFGVSSYFGKSFGGVTVNNSSEFAVAAIEQPHVVFVQGSAFGAEGYMRMSYATDTETLDRGLDAFEQWLKTAE